MATDTRIPHQWTEADLQRLVDTGQDESLQLEFKRARALSNDETTKDEISKDVSSFANSIGGTIIYGIAELKRKPPTAASISPVDPAVISKEWLDHSVTNGGSVRRLHSEP